MARLTISHGVVKNGVALITGAAVVAVLLTTINAFRRSPSPGPEGHQRIVAAASQPDSNEQVRLAFHAQVETLKARLTEDPANADLLLDIATQYHDGHKPTEAIPYYQDYLATNETNEQAWLDLASCFAELEDWQQAEAATRRLLEINPSNTSALYNLGAIRANVGDYDEARQLWEQISDHQSPADVARQAREALARLASFTS